MSNSYFISGLAVLTLSVCITRFTPFLLFGGKKKLPPWVEYLGKVLPASMMGLLVVYCLKDVDFSGASTCAPALIASFATALTHKLKGNTILSISLGTILYMFLIRIL